MPANLNIQSHVSKQKIYQDDYKWAVNHKMIYQRYERLIIIRKMHCFSYDQKAKNSKER